MSQIEVQIMGQGYLLGCPEGGRERLMQAVDRVDGAMCRIRDAGKVKARDRIAVLAALNLAFDLADRDRIASEPAFVVAPTLPAPIVAAPGVAPDPMPQTQAVAAEPGDTPAPARLIHAALESESVRMRVLIDRIDRALSRDGQLI
jgi:cell division protein ZapA